jgi:hypothetical protein
VSLDASKLTGAIGAIDLGSGTNVPGANITGTVPAARLGANLEKLAGNDGGSLTNVTSTPFTEGSGLTNLNATELRSGTVADARLSAALQALAANNGTALTGVVVTAGADVLQTNSTSQSKAGLLTLNGGATIGAKLTLTPSATQTLATGANVAADAAMVAVVGDGGAVTCGMADGTAAGQMLSIRGTHADNTVTLTNAAVVPTFRLGDNDIISFVWNGISWSEMARRDN